MATLFGVDRNGSSKQLRATVDGRALIELDWVTACIFDGLGFSVMYGDAEGSATTVGTFGAGGADLTEHDMLITLPAAGTLAVVPIYWKPIAEAIGTIAAVDVLLVYGAGGIISNGSTASLNNMRQGSSEVTACTCGILGDAGGTAITVVDTIYREGSTALTGSTSNNNPTYVPYSYKTHPVYVVEGVSKQVAGFISAQASTGFVHYAQLEIPSSSL